MVATENTQAIRHQRQAGNAVLIALMLAFSGAILGVIFGVSIDAMTIHEVWIIGFCAVVTGGLTVFVYAKPELATGVSTGVLTIYLIFHLNVASIIAYNSSGDVVRIIPYLVWFFALVMFHQFTNFGFYKRVIGLLVSLSPVPVTVFVLAHPTEPLAVEDLGALTSFLLSFFAFVVFVSFFVRHRDEEVMCAAMAEEAERSATVLRVSEERFRLLSLATNDLIWDADLKSGTMWWNNALFDSYGYDPNALANDMTAWESWVHPDDRDRVFNSLQAVIARGESNWTGEYRTICADGRTINVMDRGFILRDQSGDPVRMIGSTTDVTELRCLERKLRQSQRLEAVGQLTGGVAHDFNNILMIILGSAEALADIHANEPAAKRLIETTIQAAERGAILTSRLLSFARLQALAPKYLHPVQVLSGIEGLIRSTIDEDIKIEISAASDVWPIEVDPGELENAVLNLSINARDAMPDGGRLTIKASNVMLTRDDLRRVEKMKAGAYVMIAVTDNGCGMTPEVAERAFEPFFTTKEAGKGSGLGLSMVWGFVQQSNGHAQISSDAGEGTSVKLYFPAANRQESQVATPEAVVAPVGGTEHILVVEDDDMVREFVVMQLGSLGYAVKHAASAAEALDIMDGDASIDLLFTDVVMPGGMNGRQLVDAALIRRPDLKVLYTSAYTEDTIVHQGRLDPGVNLLGKPYRRAELATKIRSVLDSGPQTQ